MSSALRKGAIVRYVGDQYPKLAGMEGEIVGLSDWPLVQVQWPHRSDPEEIAAYELRGIRGYSKGFARRYGGLLGKLSANPATIDYGRFSNPFVGARQSYVMEGGRFLEHKYGLTHAETERLIPHQRVVVERLERWREQNGLPAPNSPLSRGALLDMLREAESGPAFR